MDLENRKLTTSHKAASKPINRKEGISGEGWVGGWEAEADFENECVAPAPSGQYPGTPPLYHCSPDDTTTYQVDVKRGVEREYLFPMDDGGPMGRRLSFASTATTHTEDVPSADMGEEVEGMICDHFSGYESSIYSTNPSEERQGQALGHKTKLSHRVRSKSMSASMPIYRSSYEGLAGCSPAATFLSQFAAPDEMAACLPTLIHDGERLDRYRLGRVIGRGSFSECREGVDETSTAGDANSKVAIKIVHNSPTIPNSFAIFDHEVEIWKNLHHPNILPLIDTLARGDVRVAISPMAERGNLVEFINEHGPMEEELARHVFKQIAEAIYHLHENQSILHGDLKLDNILLDSTNRAYICDFGLSECIDTGKTKVNLSSGCHRGNLSDSSGTRSCGSSLYAKGFDDVFCKGSLWYLAPEEFDSSLLEQSFSRRENSTLAFKSDIWALGVILYAMITSHLPWTEDFLPRLHGMVLSGEFPPIEQSVSPNLLDMIKSLLTVDPKKRPDINAVLKHSWLQVPCPT